MPAAPHDQSCNFETPGIYLSLNLFANFGPDQSNTLFSNKRSILVQPGHPILTAGEAPIDIVLLETGQVELSHKKDKFMVDAGPEGCSPIFGILESLSETDFDLSLNAVTSCEIGLVNADEFFELVRSSPSLSFRLAEIAAGLYVRTLRAARGN
jgi:CRP-like cAMP-binding protein